MLTNNEIRKYQGIHERIYGINISEKEAIESGTKLIVFLETIFKK